MHFLPHTVAAMKEKEREREKKLCCFVLKLKISQFLQCCLLSKKGNFTKSKILSHNHILENIHLIL
jgi:hypothetical protein